MRRFYSAFKGVVGSLLIASTAFVLVMAGSHVTAAASDCDDNAVIPGGVSSASGVMSAYNSGASCSGHSVSATTVRNIYSSGFFGISSSDLNKKAVLGDVYTDGSVKVQVKEKDGSTGYKTVATDAWTAGRQDISGS